MGAGAGAQKITTDVTGNDTAGMVAGMVASGVTAKGLNGIEAEANKLAKAPKGIDGVTEGAGNLAEDVGKVGKGLEGAAKGAESAAEDAGKVVKTSYGKSTLNSLKNTENFTDSAIEHIFEGQANARGKAVGYHYEGIEGTSGNVIPGTESSVNNIGVYKAQVEVNGIPKTANGGFSTFYSKNLSPQQVIDAINEAYSNCELKLGTRNTYQGVANNGMKIDMFLDQSGKIISAFPEE